MIYRTVGEARRGVEIDNQAAKARGFDLSSVAEVRRGAESAVMTQIEVRRERIALAVIVRQGVSISRDALVANIRAVEEVLDSMGAE